MSARTTDVAAVAPALRGFGPLAGAALLAALVAVGSACGGCSDVASCASDDQCDPGLRCVDRYCTAACASACGAAEVCDDGACLPRHCEGRACADNEVCFEGQCTPHGCRGKQCSPDQRCVLGGACVSRNCSGSGVGACDPQDEACDPDTKRCADASCIGVSCPPGQSCWDGACRDDSCDDGRLCKAGYCVYDNYCKDCDDAACPASQACVEGRCRAKGCLLDPPRNCPCGPLAQLCRDDEVCVGKTAAEERCVRHHCDSVTCPPGFLCAGVECVPLPCVDVRCGQDERCGADGACHKLTCSTGVCPDGYACSGDACVEVGCIGKTCGAGERCFAGGCYRTSCTDTPCGANQVCVNGTCVDVTPANCNGKVCATGYFCDRTAQPPVCKPVVCAGTSCDLCGGKVCARGERCDVSAGRCVRPCASCPKGYYCGGASGSTCIPESCLEVDCGECGTCVGGGTCVSDRDHCACSGTRCVDECLHDPKPSDCDERRECDEGEALQQSPCPTDDSPCCVDTPCVGVACKPGEVCLGGSCLPECCEGVKPGCHGVCLNGLQYYRDCVDHKCLTGWICEAGQRCVSLADPCVGRATLPQGESLYCNGVDDDGNCKADDHTYLPLPAFVNGTQVELSKITPPSGGVCGHCDSVDKSDYSCLASFTDSRSVVLFFDKDNPKRLDNPEGATACVKFNFPCGRFNASRMFARFHAAEGARPCSGEFCSAGSCFKSGLSLWVLPSGTTEWKKICGFDAYLDFDRFSGCAVNDRATGQPIPAISAAAVCRSGYDATVADVAVDGVSLVGCCIP